MKFHSFSASLAKNNLAHKDHFRHLSILRLSICVSVTLCVSQQVSPVVLEALLLFIPHIASDFQEYEKSNGGGCSNIPVSDCLCISLVLIPSYPRHHVFIRFFPLIPQQQPFRVYQCPAVCPSFYRLGIARVSCAIQITCVLNLLLKHQGIWLVCLLSVHLSVPVTKTYI